MPDFIGAFGQLDAFGLFLSTVIEQAELDLRRMSRKQREINTEAIPGRPKRKRLAFQHRGMPKACSRQGQPLNLELAHE
jgi:hypothetical protein